MTPETEVLLALMGEENARVTHYQEERTNTTNIIFVIAAAIIGLVLYDGRIDNFDWVLSLLIVVSGCLGAYLNVKYHERVHFHEAKLRQLGKLLDKEAPQLGLDCLNTKVKNRFKGAEPSKTANDADQEEEHDENGRVGWLSRFFYQRTLWKAWVFADLLVVAIGIAILMVYTAR